MRGVIYIDVLILVNAIIGYFLLRGAGVLSGKQIKQWRLALGSVLSGFISLMILLPPLPEGMLWIGKIVSLLAIAAASFPFDSPRSFAKTAFWYLLLNAALAGALFAAIYYSTPGALTTNNLAVYFNISPVLLIGCVLGVYLCVQLASFLFGRPKQNETAAFTAILAGETVEGLALIDTGFCVRDPMTGKNAFMMSAPADKTFDAKLFSAVQDYYVYRQLKESEFKLWLIPVKTAAGTRLMPAYTVQSLTLHYRGKTYFHAKLPVVFTQEHFADGSFGAIVSADFIN